MGWPSFITDYIDDILDVATVSENGIQRLAYFREHTNQKEKCLVVFGVILLSRLEITIPPCGGGSHYHHLTHRHQAENPLAATGGLDVAGDRQISRSSSGSVSEPSRSLP